MLDESQQKSENEEMERLLMVEFKEGEKAGFFGKQKIFAVYGLYLKMDELILKTFEDLAIDQDNINFHFGNKPMDWGNDAWRYCKNFEGGIKWKVFSEHPSNRPAIKIIKKVWNILEMPGSWEDINYFYPETEEQKKGGYLPPGPGWAVYKCKRSEEKSEETLIHSWYKTCKHCDYFSPNVLPELIKQSELPVQSCCISLEEE